MKKMKHRSYGQIPIFAMFIFALCLAMCFVMSPLTARADDASTLTGAGTEADPYIVTTEEALTTALAAGGNIQLDADIEATANCSIAEGTTVVLDLNGCTLDLGEHGLNNLGTLEVLDSVGNGSIIGSFAQMIYNDASFTLTSGTVSNSNSDGYTTCTIHNTSGGKVVINGGTVSAPSSGYGIYNEGGSVTINGGAVSSDASAITIYNDGSLTVTGGEIGGGTGIDSYSGTVEMTGGTIYAKYGMSVSAGTVTVSGGKISDSQLASGYTGVGIQNNGGTVTFCGSAEIKMTNDYSTGIENNEGTVYVSGGTITATGESSVAIVQGNGSNTPTLLLSDGTVTGGITAYTGTLAGFLAPGYLYYVDGTAITLTEGQTELTGAFTVAECNSHSGGTATCTELAVCDICKGEYGTYYHADEDADNYCDVCGGLIISEATFPDEIFRAYISTNFDTNADGALSADEIAAVTKIDVSSKGIETLAGVEYFTKLGELLCNDNSIEALDVSALEDLSVLNCYTNKLTALDVSQNKNLYMLACYNNKIEELDLSNNTRLYSLNCGANAFQELDVSKNTALTSLYCTNSQLTSLNVSANTALQTLYCNINQLTSLDLSTNTALKQLYCNNNQLTSLDLSNNTALTFLNCSENQLTHLDVSNNPLTSYSCYGQKPSIEIVHKTMSCTMPEGFNSANVTSVTNGEFNDSVLTVEQGAEAVTYSYTVGNITMDVTLTVTNPHAHAAEGLCSCGGGLVVNATNFPDEPFLAYIVESIAGADDKLLTTEELAAVKKISVTGLGIKTLQGIEYFTNLEKLTCASNSLTSLDVSNNTKLTDLYCYSNQLTSLDVSKNTALAGLDCSENNIRKLDVSALEDLGMLSCYSNQLEALDVSKNTALTTLDCRSNQLTSLDVSKNTALTSLDCYNNYLTSLDVSQNTKLTILSCDLQKLSIEINQLTMSYTMPEGFDSANVTGDVTGGSFSGDTLTVDEGVGTVTYSYTVGSKTMNVTLTVTNPHTHDYTKTVYTQKDATGHYTLACECNKVCEEDETFAAHTYESSVCTACGYDCLHGNVEIDTGVCNACKKEFAISVAIGEDAYFFDSFAEALAKAQSGTTDSPATIKFYTDLTVNETATLTGGVVTVDLNGKAITFTGASGSYYITLDNATLTFKDSGTDGTVTFVFDGVYYGVALTNASKLTVDGGTYSVTPGHAFQLLDGSTMEQNGGTITNGIFVDNGKYILNDGYMAGFYSNCDGGGEYAAELVLNGGEICASSWLLNSNCAPDSIVTITGGKYYSSSTNASLLVYQPTEMQISGGTFSGGIQLTSNLDDYDTLKEILAPGYAFYTESGEIVVLTDEQTEITEYVTVACGHYDEYIDLVPNNDGTHNRVCTVCETVIAANISCEYLNKVDDDYLKSEANCLSRYVYYKSCACGHKSTDTFEAGEKNPENHTDTNDKLVSNGNGTHNVVWSCCEGVVTENVTCIPANCTEASSCECGYAFEKLHDEHTFSGDYSYDGNGHWQKCENCDEISTVEYHSGSDDGDCTTPVTCVCGYVFSEGNPEHNFSNTNHVFYDDTHHFLGCINCGTPQDDSAKVLHDFSVLESNEYDHWYKCSGCQKTTATVEHSFTDENFDSVCDVCNETITHIEFSKVSLTLGGDIGINFFFTLSNAVIDSENAYFFVTYPNGKTETIAVSSDLLDAPKGDTSGNTYYKVTAYVAAKEMADKVKVELFVGEFSVKEFSYSIQNYAQVIIGDGSYDEELVDLVKKMLNYGAASQLEFEYNTDNLANSVLSDADKTVSTVDASTLTGATTSGTVSGFEYQMFSCILETKTTLRQYFTLEGDASAYTFTIDGESVTPTQTTVDGVAMYYIDVANIAAKDMKGVHTLVITKGEEKRTITCSVHSYMKAVLVQNSDDTNLVNTIYAMYEYNQSAEQYLVN